MCFNASTSLLTFIIGITGSFLLINFGNPIYVKENNVFGIFFIFIALIQLMDFFLWKDLNNKYGINHLFTLLGPLINTGQPVILYLIKYFYFKPKISLGYNINTFYALFNLLYLIYLFNVYFNFITNGNLITSTKNGHLYWPWIEFSNPIFYVILLALNMFYFTNFTYSLAVFFITYFCLLLSYIYFYNNLGELWCFFGAFIPIILIIISYFI
jgi:hypothetical protein